MTCSMLIVKGLKMKTLNEVIDLMEGADFIDWGADALHYLKAYKEDKDDLTALRAYWKEQHENNALTWDELRTMEGKPVWVEILSDEIDLSSRWMMVAQETKTHSLPLAYTDDMGHWIFGHEDKLGKTWQAYRKEREA